MIEFRNILCPVDLSEASNRALAYAAAVARWYDARLTVLHVAPTLDPMQIRSGTLGDSVTIVQPIPQEEIRKGLGQALEEAGGAGREATLAVDAGNPAAAIVDHALRMTADLLVIGTHGRSGFDRLVLGSVTEKVLRKAPCPILTVPPLAPPDAPAEVVFKRILCPMDFSPSALQAFGFGVDLARQANGSVTLLHVIEWLVEHQPRAQVSVNVSEYREQLAVDAHERLQALIDEEPRTWCDLDEEVVMGRPYREILAAAEARRADLIVMGAQGRGGVGLALFGSTTHQVVRGAACPVLTVRG